MTAPPIPAVRCSTSGASLERQFTSVERPTVDNRSHSRQGTSREAPVMSLPTEEPKHRRILYQLTWLAAAMSLGHHIDHLIRGNAVGWPVTSEVNAFTASLVVYPIIATGLLLYRAGRVGPGFWALVSGGGAVFVSAVHFGPAAVEPPELILDHYDPPILGWLAFTWLVTFATVLAITSLYETRLWWQQRQARPTTPPSCRCQPAGPAAAQRCSRQRGGWRAGTGRDPGRAVAGGAAAASRRAGRRWCHPRWPGAQRRGRLVDGLRRAGRSGHPGRHRLAAAPRRPLLPPSAGAAGRRLAGRAGCVGGAGGHRAGRGLWCRDQQGLLRRRHPAHAGRDRRPTPGQHFQRAGGASAGRAGRAGRLPGRDPAAVGTAPPPLMAGRRHCGGRVGWRACLLPAADQPRQP